MDTLKIDKILHGTPTPTAKRKCEKLEMHKMTTTPTIQSYCLACRGKRLMQHVGYVTLKNGKKAVKGECSSCGKKMYTIMKTSKSATEKTMTPERHSSEFAPGGLLL